MSYKAIRRGIKEGYRSGLELDISNQLKDQGVDGHYEEYKLTYTKPETKHTYTPDFYLEATNIYVETKGRFTTSDRQKHIMIRNSNPDLDIRFVFQNPNAKLYKGSKTTYAMWCDKHGFEYSKKSIPTEWITGEEG